MTFIIAVTILSVLIPCYVFVGYPFLLILLSKVIKGKKTDKKAITPSITVIVSCYNEAQVIRKKIENCLALDYPKEQLQFVFVSDGSDDGTDDIVKEYEKEGVRLVRQEGRLGKTSGLNLAIADIKSEVIVFSDANAMYAQDAVKHLVANFNDPSVGYVVGAALYIETGSNSASCSEDSYWQYEMFMKNLESRLHSVVGGDGAIYAIRSQLYETLGAEDINDFVNPLQIIAKGYRGVFDAEAKCFEEAAGSFEKEGRRKERIVNRSFRGLMKVKGVMNPFKVGFFSLQIISHKLLRWLIPFFVLIMTLGFLILAYSEYKVFQVLLLLEIVFFWLSAIGFFFSRSKNLSAVFYYPYYFVLVNISSFVGVLKALKGDIQVTWASPRHEQRLSALYFSKTGFSVSAMFLLSILLFMDVYLQVIKS